MTQQGQVFELKRSGRRREQESDALTPLDKTRSALEAKAAKGDVYAARELPATSHRSLTHADIGI
jgi:hypothetical protein